MEEAGQCEAANFASPLSSPTVEAVKMPEKIVSHRSVKAIQTKWRNRHYRSRLEARWAVFFDTIGLKFMYEPEGYELPDGTRYLPDFYLPEVRWFVEVKPFTHTSIKAYHFARYGGGAVLVLDGDPDFRSYTGLQTVSIDGEPEQVEGMEYSLDIWGGQNRCNFEEGRLFCGPDYESIFLGITNVEEAFSIRYRAGVEAALSARFGS